MTDASNDDLTTQLGVEDLSPPYLASTPFRLVVLMGAEPGRRYTLSGKSALVGRADDCDVQLEDSRISRRHCRVYRDERGTWQVSDLGSRNGTIVNGERVQLKSLALGDRIQLSLDTLLLFTRQDPLEERLMHRQQMEVIGQLAAGIAHDFNNLLSVIKSSLAHLDSVEATTALSEPDVMECRADMMEASSRAAELTSRLLGLARRGHREQGSLELVNVTELCNDVLLLARRTFGRSIQTKNDVEENLVLRGDHASLHQALMNLVINARDAMPMGGEIRLSAKHENAALSTAGSQQFQGRIRIEVSDEGIGMDERTRRRVFEPFFTTKEGGAGSGLGLATVYEVTTSHGGYVEVESEPGKGATFRLHLPAARPPSDPVRATSRRRLAPTWDASSSAPSGGRRLLLVDDQELVRRSMGRLLRAMGYRVSFADDYMAAIETIRATRPDAVLVDLDVPGGAPADLLEQLRSGASAVPVVLITGDKGHRRFFRGRGATEVLIKPIEANALRAAILMAVGQSSST